MSHSTPPSDWHPSSTAPNRRGNGSGKPKLDLPVAMIIMGAIFFTYVLTMMTPTFVELSNNRTSVEGQVSELVYSTSYTKKAHAKTILCSRVAHYSVGGEDYWVNSTIKRKDCPWGVGQSVKVSYESGSPREKAIVLDDATINLKLNIIIGSLSLAALAGGVVLLVNRIKRRRLYMAKLNV